jgi:hypothetical protein
LDKLFRARSLTKKLPVTSREPVITKLSAFTNDISPTKVVLPVTLNEPVNLCVSSNESPNLVEPLSKIIEEETNSV